MKSRLAFFGCFLLTVIVVHTCIRIEVLNALNEYYLPRTDFGEGNPKWRDATQTSLLISLEHRIADERLSEFVVKHPTKSVTNVAQFTGPPYSQEEQNLIDKELADHALRAELYAWVSCMGLLQYVLAPVAFVWAIALIIFDRSIFFRVASSVFAVSVAASIWLMIYRGYFTSLGW